MTADPAPPSLGARVVAVDWSGAAVGAARKIWLAEVTDGRVSALHDATALTGGRQQPRQAMTDHLATMVRAAAASRTPLVIGLDFAFSLPIWFLDDARIADAPALWARAAIDGDAWLSCAAPPFWGRRGTKAQADRPQLRAAEREVSEAVGARPSSVFKLVGPGQVGAASVRGMSTLAALRAAGARVWPFDDPVPGVPTVIEIWPRAAYAERVVKSDPDARAAYLDRHAPALESAMRRDAAASDDAFDALTAALALWNDRATLAALPRARNPIERREGRIWWPGLPL